MGRFDKPIIQDPILEFVEEDRNIDLLIMENTFGNRLPSPKKLDQEGFKAFAPSTGETVRV